MSNSKRKADCTPEEWAAYLQYMREWRIKNLEAQRQRKRDYYHRPEVKARHAAYAALPTTKARKAERDNSKEAREKARARADTPEAKLRKVMLQKKRRTGFTESLVHALLEAQNGCCAICGTLFENPKQIRSDHCHSSNTPRGLLCHPCNIIEGFISRLPIRPDEFAKRLDAYLASPPAQSVKPA